MCKLVVVMLQTNATCQLFMNLLLVRVYGYHISDQGYVVSVFILTEGKVLLPLEDLTVEDDIKYMWFHNAVWLIFHRI